MASETMTLANVEPIWVLIDQSNNEVLGVGFNAMNALYNTVPNVNADNVRRMASTLELAESDEDIPYVHWHNGYELRRIFVCAGIAQTREEVLRQFDAPLSSLHAQQMADEIVRLRAECARKDAEIAALDAWFKAHPDQYGEDGWIMYDSAQRLIIARQYGFDDISAQSVAELISLLNPGAPRDGE